MFRFIRVPAAFLSLLLAFCVLSFVAPSPAFAQSAPTSPVSGTDAPSSCGFTDISCRIFGNPADLQKNIDKAKAEVQKLGCWSCDVFNAFGDIVFQSGRDVAGKADSALKPVIVAVATLFALFYMGSAFVSGDASDLLSRWKVFWRLLIAVAVGTGWLSAGSFETTWSYVYGPLLQIPLAVEQAVSGGASGGGCEARPPANAPAAAVPAMNEMAAVVCGGNKISLEGIAFGIGLSNTGDGIIGSLVNLVTGVILMIVFGWIAITFPLRFIDVLLRMMVVGIVAPVLVVCAVFKPTRSYVQLGIKNVLYAGALFAFTGIMFKVGDTFMTAMIKKAILAPGTQSAGELLGRGIVLIGSGVIFSAMLRMAPSLAAEFSSFSGQSGGVGDAATGAAGAIVAVPAKGAGMMVGASTAGKAAGAASSKALAKGVTS